MRGCLFFDSLEIRKSFFLFSVVFMISMTLFSDWMNGPHQQFNFREDFVSRSAATLTGALIELFLHVDQTTEKQDQT